MKNNIATKSYLVKRLKDSGYETWMIFDRYSETDPRKYTLLIDPSGAAVYCTCYENLASYGEIMFELHDGGQFIPYRLRIQTDSFEIIAKHLNEYGIVRKYESKTKESDEG